MCVDTPACMYKCHPCPHKQTFLDHSLGPGIFSSLLWSALGRKRPGKRPAFALEVDQGHFGGDFWGSDTRSMVLREKCMLCIPGKP